MSVEAETTVLFSREFPKSLKKKLNILAASREMYFQDLMVDIVEFYFEYYNEKGMEI